MTDIIRVAPDAPDPAAIARAAECLRNGGLVAFPTETVYGLGVNALDRAAVKRLFAAKQRPATDPLIVHVGSFESIAPLVSRVPKSARSLARHFWPGPLTLIFPRSAQVPDEVTAGLPSVAVRVPAHPVARALIDAAAVPVAAPSANLFSRPSPTQASHVIEDLDGRIDLVLDGGSTTIGVESTVVDLTGDAPTVLRPGAVTIEMLRKVVRRVRMYPALGTRDPGSGNAPTPSPGMLEKHYSPRAVLTLYEGEIGSVLPSLIDAAGIALAEGKSVGVIAAEEDRSVFDSLGSHAGLILRAIGSEEAPDVVASKLYTTLRELDAAGADVILVRGFSDHGLWAAVQDRLRRASAGRIIRSS
ncbi:MAG TPA: L-threonylcarbamoyladenylate synthase [Vicinamibacterales bacterium]|nr:L-threonylcarbamoyladenylate synthase [Vicinamibacterales bacterium]